MEDEYDDMDSFKREMFVKEHKQNFENEINRSIFKTIFENSDEFIEMDLIPYRVQTVNNLIKMFLKTEEYEKCSFLKNLLLEMGVTESIEVIN